MENLTKDDLKKYTVNLEKQKKELEQELKEIQIEIIEVRGVIRWLRQMINIASPTNSG